MAAVKHNDKALTTASLEARKAAAVAVDADLGNVAESLGARLNHTEVEIVEQSKGPDDSGEKLHQQVAVERDEAPTGRRGRGQR